MRNPKDLKKQRSIFDYLFFNGYRFEVSIETIIFITVILSAILLAVVTPNPSVALTV